jgi:hypothetical protein
MTPQKMTREILEQLINNYNISTKKAPELAMFAVDLFLSYEKIYDTNFWFEVMDELESL